MAFDPSDERYPPLPHCIADDASRAVAVKTREPRRKVLVRARMRLGADWGDVTIHNMSSRGLLATSETPCRRGTIVEIRRVHHVIIGRVVWQSGAYFGLRTQDRIDMDGLVAAKPPATKPERSAEADAGERRTARRVIPTAEREAQSRRFAAMFQFAVMIAVIGAVALFAAQGVGNLLSRPFEIIGSQLDGKTGAQESAKR